MKVILVLVLATVAYARLAALSTAAQNVAAFEQFKKTYGKTYASPAEESLRFSIFQQNVGQAARLNAKERVHKPYGVTKFMDLTPAEFSARYLMKNVNLTSVRAGGERALTSAAPAGTLPDVFDWTAQAPSCVTAVKDQGQCGSCWAFSGVETIESVCCLAGNKLTVLSEQQIVDCDTDGGVMGCDGGFPEDVYTYAQRFGGLDTETSYPYQAQDGTCQSSTTGKYKCPIASWKWVSQDASTENVMQKYIYENSPVSIACDAETWQYYTTGIVTADSCGTDLDHAIQITGWTNAIDGSTPAWTVRNSWGADWGMNGYIYLALGDNTCGVATHVTVPCVTTSTGATRC